MNQSGLWIKPDPSLPRYSDLTFIFPYFYVFPFFSFHVCLYVHGDGEGFILHINPPSSLNMALILCFAGTEVHMSCTKQCEQNKHKYLLLKSHSEHYHSSLILN
jgi:hypothetical protein